MIYLIDKVGEVMNILVCATAARNSGALIILKQFLTSLSTFIGDNKYFIFVAKGISFPKLKGVLYIPISTEKWIDRINWDQKGLKKWVEVNRIEPDLIISFQNTGVNYKKDVPQLIYYHQLLSLIDYHWNFFSRKERLFYLYQKVYPYFIRRYMNRCTKFVVQTSFVKECFIKKFRVNPARVHVIRPDIERINYIQIKKRVFNDNCIHFLYPATPLTYKNHRDIILSLLRIKSMAQNQFLKIRIHFTFNKSEDEDLYKLILKNSLEKNFIFEGILPHDELLSLYKSVDAILYPSYIETLGLPLLESAALGLPILVSDLPYAKDVVGNYEGATFIELHNIQSWADAMLNLCENPIRYSPLLPSYESNWKVFFCLIDQMTKNK